MTVRIEGPATGFGVDARAVLDALPTWFGISEANDHYVAHVDATPSWRAVDDDATVAGVLSPKVHTGMSWEIELVAVRSQFHRPGVGRALVDAFEAAALADGYDLVQVKTLGPSHADAGYALTRAFYVGLGYRSLEATALWGAHNPALIMVKLLDPGSALTVLRTRRGTGRGRGSGRRGGLCR